MNSSKRQLQTRELNQYELERWQFRVLAGLNGRIQAPSIATVEPDALLPRNKQSIERVIAFVRTLKAAVPVESGDALGLSPKALGFPNEEQMLKWANQDLKRYRQYPQIVPDPHSGGLTTEMAFCDGDRWENIAIEEILWLLKEGQLFRLSQCWSCKSWFYGIRKDQRFCKTACRQKEHSKGEDSKRKRKEYMRKYRADGNEQRAKSRASKKGNRKSGR